MNRKSGFVNIRVTGMDEAAAMRGGAAAAGGRNRTKTKSLPVVGGALKCTHYILHNYIIYNIGRAALEQAYRSLCKLGSNYIHIILWTKSISIKSIKSI